MSLKLQGRTPPATVASAVAMEVEDAGMLRNKKRADGTLGDADSGWRRKRSKSLVPIADDKAARDAEWLANREYVAEWTAEYEKAGVRSVADYWRICCARCPDRLCMEAVGTNERMTYRELDVESNKMANWLLNSAGIRPGTTVGLMMKNCPLFVITWLGLAKIGVPVAMINTRLRSGALVHALRAGNAGFFIVSNEFEDSFSSAVEAAAPNALMPEAAVIWAEGDKPASPLCASHLVLSQYAEASGAPIDASMRQHVQLDHPVFYIYTSGTTGPSKAAVFSHRRFMGAGITWSRPMRLTKDDKYYVVLPMYHGNGGVVAVSAVWHSSCSMVIRRSFSVTHFWRDVQQHSCTAMIYIGELWRYLYNQVPVPEEQHNTMRVIAGNGLRPDIWDAVIRRFGIDRVVEHYGLTEMPAGPYMNSYGRPGACGYIPPHVRSKEGADKLIRFDVETGAPSRDPTTGRFVEITAPGVSGEVIFKLTKPYPGYTDPVATEKRIYRNCFEDGDAWFSTGDLLRLDEDGFFYFVDRIGDTFRWKGENVSTNEVGEALCAFPGVKEANVYGVEYPFRDGRAGMASLVLSVPAAEFDFKLFYQYVQRCLPSFAQPLFLRVRVFGEDNQKTTTLKFQKFQYQQEGFHPNVVTGDMLLFRDDTPSVASYVPLTMNLYNVITSRGFRV